MTHNRTATNNVFGPHDEGNTECHGTECPTCGCCMHCAGCNACECTDLDCRCAL